ncbi:RNA-dependent RNA polymerase 1 [Citrus sinensis]|nr:RNA-dependent RNA polymerase 1 [Citrus sinensis]
MAKMIMLYGFASLASPKAVKEFLEEHTGEGTVSGVEVGQNKGSRAHAIVEFTTVEAADFIKCLARERLSYGNSFLKASSAKRRTPHFAKRTPHYKLGGDLKLNFGCQISKDKFSVFWSQENVSVKLCSDLRKFGFFLSYESVDYKLELSNESIWQIELHRPSGHSVSLLLANVIAEALFSLLSVASYIDEAEHESTHLGVPAGMFLNTSPAAHLGIVMKSARANLKHPGWQNCYAELPLPALIPKALKDFFHYKESLNQDGKHALEMLFHLRECCYDPVSWLREQYRKHVSSGQFPTSPAVALDGGLIYVNKILVTPSKVYFCGPEISLSNRVVRSYPDEIDNFLRLSFVDEDLGKLYSTVLSPQISSTNGERRTRIYERVLSTLRNGIVIGDKKFETLAFSNSQERENTLWMFASRPELTAADIRERMGDFREIKNVTKYAARLGKISAELAETVAKKCGYAIYTPSAFQIRYGGYKDSSKVQEALELMSSAENTNVLKELLNCGYKPDAEPFLSMMPQTFHASNLLELRTRARIFIQNGQAMMGCLDEKGTLEYGDMRVLRAVDVPALHHMVDCVLFPAKGERPHTNECSGSDQDGEIYFVCWDHDRIPPLQFQPTAYTPAPEKILARDVTIEDVEEYFADYIVNDSLGIICNAHVVYAYSEPDKAMSNRCPDLVKLSSIVGDFSKTGVAATIPSRLRVKIYPDFMEKQDKTWYESQHIVGNLYREVNGIAPSTTTIKSFAKEGAMQFYDTDMEVNGFKEVAMQFDGFKYRTEYDNKLGNLMDYYGIKTEAEMLSRCIMEMAKSFDKKRDLEAISFSVRSLRKEARAWFNKKKNDSGSSHKDVRKLVGAARPQLK